MLRCGKGKLDSGLVQECGAAYVQAFPHWGVGYCFGGFCTPPLSQTSTAAISAESPVSQIRGMRGTE